MIRCARCGRPTAARWRRCPFCRGHTGVPHHASYPYIDRRLNSWRAFGIGVASGVAAVGAFVWFAHPDLGPAVVAPAACFAMVHLVMPLHAHAWRVAHVLWTLGAAALVVVLAPKGWPMVAAIGPVVAAVWMWRVHGTTIARLEGREPVGFVIPASEVPAWTPCTRCGSRDAEVVAPIYCLSVISASFRWTGKFESLCQRHARERGLGAVVFCTLFGWWGIPWGVVWTFEAIELNFSTGGALLGSAVLADIRRHEAEHGGVGEETPAADFVFGFLLGLVVAGVVAYAI